MHALLVSASIAAAMTAIFAFRYAASKEPRRLALYFLLFFGLEWAAETWLLPQGALPPEVGYVCFGIALLFVVASTVRDRLDADA